MPRKRRVVIYVDEPQYAMLKRLQRTTGASIAELCRRAIAGLNSTQAEKKRLK